MIDRVLFKRLAQIAFIVMLQALLLFGGAGRLDWWAAWAYTGIYVALIAFNAFTMLRGRQELIAERAEVRAGWKGWDKIIGSAMSLSWLATLLAAGLDMRFGWSPALPGAAQAAGAVLVALGFLTFSWAMASNPFFSSVVRIQKERGHTVVTGGPYRFVRHPGYAGSVVYILATPLLLGSLWAYVPAVLACILLVARTALEDRTLLAELPGYREYAGRVPYRLLPGLW